MKSICLVGMPGSGKTTIGERLAQLTRRTFIDTDKLIETHFDLSIRQIFEQKGEKQFRLHESQILKEALSNEGAIISTGGGLPAFSDNMAAIKKYTYSVYLKMEISQLLYRLNNFEEYKKRPLLLTNNEKTIKNKLQILLSKREPFYLKSDFIIDEISDIETCCSLILYNFEDFGRR